MKCGAYEIHEAIGQGGMGTVYRATGPDGTAVAIKLLHLHLTMIDEYVRRFQREAKLAEKLAHPNVVRVLGSGEDGGQHYIVMELVEGESLTQRLERSGIRAPGVKTSTGRTTRGAAPGTPAGKEPVPSRAHPEALAAESSGRAARPDDSAAVGPLPPAAGGRQSNVGSGEVVPPRAGLGAAIPASSSPCNLPLPEVIKILRQVAGVLQAAADIGLVHRDLKPQNILLDKSGNAKVLDFGLAKDLDALTSMLSMTGQSIGTPPYMSPEQCEGTKEIDIRSDLYSLGATAYQMLTGRPPFPGPSHSAYIRQHIEQIPEPVCKVNPAVPRNLSQVVDRLLAKKPEDRHQTPAEMIEDLNRVERGEVPLKLYRGKKSSQHGTGRLLAVAAAAVLVCLLAVGGWLWLRGQDAGAEVSNAVAAARAQLAENRFDEALRTLAGPIAAHRADNPELVREAETLRDQIPDLKARWQSRQEAAALAERERAAAEARAERERQEAQAAAAQQQAAAQAEQTRQRELRKLLDAAGTILAGGDESRLEQAKAAAEQAQDLARSAEETAAVKELAARVAAALKNRRDFVAVVDFEVDGSVRDKTITGRTVAVKLEQAVSERFQPVARSTIYRALEELKFSASDLADREKARKFGKLVSAQYLIAGNVVQMGEIITIAAQLYPVETGVLRQTAEVEARSATEFNALFAELARLLPMTNPEKKQYLDEQRNYPRLLAEGQALLARHEYPEAVKALDAARRCKATPEVSALLAQAQAKAAELERCVAGLSAQLEAGRGLQAKADWAALARLLEGARPAEPFPGAYNREPLQSLAGQADALLAEANRHLEPTLEVTVELNGRAVTGAQVRISPTCPTSQTGQTGQTSRTFKLTPGTAYTLTATLPAGGGKSYTTDTFRTTADWRGPRRWTAKIEEVKMRAPAGFKLAAGTTAEPYTGTGWAKEIVHEATGIEMVYVPAGSFTMGSPASEAGRANDETQHRVTLTKGFYLGKYEVTQAQWQQVMGNNPSYFQNAGRNAPVEQVSWDDCQGFIGRLGNGFRLPTEAEWEYACRAGTTGALYTGALTIRGQNNGPELDPIAWYGGNSGVNYAGGYDSSGWPEKQYNHSRAGTHPVGQKLPNAWGLHDMHGNVWEWCQDWYGEYPAGAVTDPLGPRSGSDRVSRAAAAGASTPGTAVRRIASGARPATATTAWAAAF